MKIYFWKSLDCASDSLMNTSAESTCMQLHDYCKPRIFSNEQCGVSQVNSSWLQSKGNLPDTNKSFLIPERSAGFPRKALDAITIWLGFHQLFLIQPVIFFTFTANCAEKPTGAESSSGYSQGTVFPQKTRFDPLSLHDAATVMLFHKR